jgi:hypothetical protein
MRVFDFSSWQGILSTLLGLAIITLLGVGIRLLVMQTIQQRRERENRQINERLRTLIAAYKTLGGSFTGDLSVDPTHMRDLQRRGETADPPALPAAEFLSTDRSRRIRDAVEAALSDIILLGTDEQVRLATAAANELVAGRPVHTDALVVSLRNFIREVLDLNPITPSVDIPKQGPARPGASKQSGRGEGGEKERGGGGRGGGVGAGAGTGAGVGVGLGGGLAMDSDNEGKP